MKYELEGDRLQRIRSRPARALWIEIAEMGEYIPIEESRPARALWIEIVLKSFNRSISWSRPARALWIEIRDILGAVEQVDVEAREGLVD